MALETMPEPATAGRRAAGQTLVGLATLLLFGAFALQLLYKSGAAPWGFESWRVVLYAYLVWGVALGVAQVLMRGEAGRRALFVLPAVLFTVAMVIFPTLFGLYIAFTDWNLSSVSGRQFNGLDNFRQMLVDPYYRNAILNMVYYVLAVWSNMSSPSASRFFSTPRSGRGNFSAWSSCCRSCCRRWRSPG